MADYTHRGADDVLYYDRSRFGNHGALIGGPSAAAELCTSSAPAQAIESYINIDQRRRVLVIAGGLVYDAEVR